MVNAGLVEAILREQDDPGCVQSDDEREEERLRFPLQFDHDATDARVVQQTFR